MISDYNRLSGLQKVAILFSILGESLALNLVKELDKTELRKIRAAMRGVNSVAFAVKKQVMEDIMYHFIQAIIAEEYLYHVMLYSSLMQTANGKKLL